MFHVLSPNSNKNSTFKDYEKFSDCNLKMIQTPEKNPSQQHKSAKQHKTGVVLHSIVQLIKSFIISHTQN